MSDTSLTKQCGDRGLGRDSLGDRMKGYERAYKIALPRRMPVVIRVDGKAFHTLTRGCEKPFDERLMAHMNKAAIALCEEIQGAQLAYVQSDEISVLVHNYKRLKSEAWFDNELQKMVSVAASTAAVHFTLGFDTLATFDARAFVLPEAEVCNYFIWRQQDATRNSIQMATRAVYSHAQADGKNTSEMQEMLHAKGINWNDYPVACKRGRCVVREAFSVFDVDGQEIRRSRWVVQDPPIFSQDRAYIERHLAVEPEDRATPLPPKGPGTQ